MFIANVLKKLWFLYIYHYQKLIFPLDIRMASLLRFVVNPVELQNAIKVKHDLAESSRRLHFIAARKIQVSYN